MSSSNTDWQALPQRRKKARNIGSRQQTAGNEDDNIGTTDSSSINELEVSASSLHGAEVDENIEARKRIKRAAATLDGKDGCAGEFYEYLDHTADVQFHTWGPDLTSAFETMAPCMFNFITDLATVEEDPSLEVRMEVKGHDMYSLLFAYLDELLFRFCTDGFCCRRATNLRIDRDEFKLEAVLHGEAFNPAKHPQGTEIKAITYSNMQIHENEGKSELYVIVDI